MGVNMAALRAMTKGQLHELNTAVVAVLRERQREQQQSAMMTLRVGMMAAFTDSRFGRRVKCRIEKFNQKTCNVAEVNDAGLVVKRWRVPPTMLSPV